MNGFATFTTDEGIEISVAVAHVTGFEDSIVYLTGDSHVLVPLTRQEIADVIRAAQRGGGL